MCWIYVCFLLIASVSGVPSSSFHSDGIQFISNHLLFILLGSHNFSNHAIQDSPSSICHSANFPILHSIFPNFLFNHFLIVQLKSNLDFSYMISQAFLWVKWSSILLKHEFYTFFVIVPFGILLLIHGNSLYTACDQCWHNWT